MMTNYDREIVRGYYQILRGSAKDFPLETVERVVKFGTELRLKREYDKFTTFETNLKDMVIAQNLRLFSFCEHHLLPFFGVVNIGYIPFGQIFGLSKIQRVVDKFASKPTLQEKLTDEIATFFCRTSNSPHVMVQIKAIHTCVIARGTQSTNAQFTTTSINGNFKDPAVRNEFLQTLQSNSDLRII
jgi:GTP cyclohydrolase IA